MIRKWCSSCFRVTLHNPMQKAGEYRCTFCGHPVGTGPKREANEALRKAQASKPKDGNEACGDNSNNGHHVIKLRKDV